MDIRRDFAEYLYNRLPKVYRYNDKEQILKAFIETFVEGGFNKVIDDNLKLFDLLDVDKCPKEYLPLLASSYGLTYTEEIPELFFRRLLKNITTLYQRKGTKSAIRYLARELTGFDSEIIENKDFTDVEIEASGWDIQFKHYRNFVLKLKAPYETSMLDVKEDVIKIVINDFLPTNSNVLVVTSYWFQDEHNNTKQTVESAIKQTLEEYNEYIKSISDFLCVEYDSMPSLYMNEEIYSIPVSKVGFITYGNSFLNQSLVGSTLFTNGLLFRELVKDVWSENTYKDYLETAPTSHSLENVGSENLEVVSSTQINDYGILNLKEDTNNYSEMHIEGDNSIIGDYRCRLNKFYTNGLITFDKVTIDGVSNIIIL